MADLANVSDVEDIWRALSIDEALVAQRLIKAASAIVRRRIATLDAAVTAGAIDPTLVSHVVASMVYRVMQNPDSVRSETLGQYSVTYERSASALTMTDDELALLGGKRLSVGTIPVQPGLPLPTAQRVYR